MVLPSAERSLANLGYFVGTRHVLFGCSDVLRNTCWLFGATLVLKTSNKLFPASRYFKAMSGIMKSVEETATMMLEQLVDRAAVHKAGPAQEFFSQ